MSDDVSSSLLASFDETRIERTKAIARSAVDHPSSRYRVGMRFKLGDQTWAVTALDFIFDKATLRPCDGDDGPIDYSGQWREIPLLQIPLDRPVDG